MKAANNNMIVSSVKSSSSNTNKVTRQELASSCFGRVEKTTTSTLSTPYTPPHPGRRRPTPTSTACVWEDFSEYSLSIYDEDDDTSEVDEEDTATLSLLSNYDNDKSSSSSLTSNTNTNEPRPGSLLELILKEDMPKISGCNYTQKMRKRRGSLMQERIIDEFELLKLQYGGNRNKGNEESLLDCSHRTR